MIYGQHSTKRYLHYLNTVHPPYFQGAILKCRNNKINFIIKLRYKRSVAVWHIIIRHNLKLYIRMLLFYRLPKPTKTLRKRHNRSAYLDNALILLCHLFSFIYRAFAHFEYFFRIFIKMHSRICKLLPSMGTRKQADSNFFFECIYILHNSTRCHISLFCRHIKTSELRNKLENFQLI